MYLQCAPERVCKPKLSEVYACDNGAAPLAQYLVCACCSGMISYSYGTSPVFACAVYKQLGKLHCLHQDDQMCQLVHALKGRGARLLTPRRPTPTGDGSVPGWRYLLCCSNTIATRPAVLYQDRAHLQGLQMATHVLAAILDRQCWTGNRTMYYAWSIQVLLVPV